MSKVHELRAKADQMLDNLEARAVALENKIGETNDQFADRLQNLKAQISDKASGIGAKVAEVQGLADEQKTKVKGSIEHLQLQLALGRVATKDALLEQKQMIDKAAIAVRTHIRASLDQSDADLDKEIDELIDALVELDAELEAAELAWDAEWRAEVAAANAQWEARKKELKAEIDGFRSQLKQRKDLAEDKLGDFHTEMADAFSKIGSAFRKLAS
jgi:hypothetical protein